MTDPTREAAGPPAGAAPPPRPRVVLCDEGELDDVFGLLLRLGQRPLRLHPDDLAELREWERPERLWITSARIALGAATAAAASVAVPESCTSVAVTDSASHSASAALLRRGFHYVVRRPVHPEALRLLLVQVLWRGHEHRAVTRFPFGGEIRWRSGLRRGHCAMVEISAHGCRLLCREPFRLGEAISLRVPAALTGSRDLRLRGRILRRHRGVGGSEPQLAVQFERLPARSVAHLDALLAERASGPAVMPGAAEVPPAARRRRRGRSRLLSLTRDEPAPGPDPAPARLGVERRRVPRGVWQHEVLALDPAEERVLHTLLGSDLSVGGVRVEPHPWLRIGDRLRLALYDAEHPEPMLLTARVAHDEGRRGVGLVFLELGDAERVWLDRMVSALPPVASLSEDGEKPQGVVLGEIVSLASDAPESAPGSEQRQREAQDDDDAADHDDREA